MTIEECTKGKNVLIKGQHVICTIESQNIYDVNIIWFDTYCNLCRINIDPELLEPANVGHL